MAPRETEPRFIAKIWLRQGRIVRWGVYDRLVGSWPGERPGLGRVKQQHDTEESAWKEATRLNEATDKKT